MKHRSREYLSLPAEIRELVLAPKRSAFLGLHPTIKAAILAEPVSVSNSRVAARYRVSIRAVGRLRKAAGILTPGMIQNASLPGRVGWRGAPQMPPPASEVAGSNES